MFVAHRWLPAPSFLRGRTLIPNQLMQLFSPLYFLLFTFYLKYAALQGLSLPIAKLDYELIVIYYSHFKLFIVLCSLFIVLCSLFIVLCSLFIVLCSLFIVLCSLFIVLCSFSLTFHLFRFKFFTLFTIHCSLFIVHYLSPF